MKTDVHLRYWYSKWDTLFVYDVWTEAEEKFDYLNVTNKQGQIMIRTKLI
jgi:hypothetical protein